MPVISRINILGNPGLVAFVMGALLLAASAAPIPYRFAVAPPNQVYNGTEFWSDDYSAYVSYIIQGQQGKWLAYDTHTSEPNLPGIIIHEEYVLWGKLTGLLGINPIYAYHLFRFFLGAVLLVVLWQFTKLIFSESSLRLTAYFLVLFVGGFAKTQATGTPPAYIPWLTELYVFYRFVALPHYLLGNIFFLTSLIQLIKLQRRATSTIFHPSFLLLILSGIGAGFTHAVSLVTLYVVRGIWLLLEGFILAPRRLVAEIVGLVIFVVLTMPILIYFRHLVSLPPWSNLSAAWEATTQYYVPLKDVVLAIGPTALLSPFGLVALLRGRTIKKEGLLLLAWFLSFFLLFYFSYPFLRISQVRFFQTYIFIPAALLAAPAVVWTSEWLGGKLRFGRRVGLGLVLVLLFVPTFPLFKHDLVSRFTFFSDFDYLTYPPKDWAAGIYWLRDNTDHNSVVLGAWQAGHHIPFMAGNYVYWGHMWGTLDLGRKQELVGQFFGGKMTAEGASRFLAEGKIDYVFYGYEERGYGGDLGKYRNLLSPIHELPGLTIFKFRH